MAERVGKASNQWTEQMLRALETYADEAGNGKMLLNATELMRLDRAYQRLQRARETNGAGS